MAYFFSTFAEYRYSIVFNNFYINPSKIETGFIKIGTVIAY